MSQIYLILKPSLKNQLRQTKKARGHSQCKWCQPYGHTLKYCCHSPRCVKCSQGHFPEECVKPRDLPVKCALCAGDHTANFKGCSSYKKFALSKNKKSAFRFNSNTNVQTPPKVSSNEVLGDHVRQLPRKSYAATTKTVTSSMDSILNVLSELISNFNSLLRSLTKVSVRRVLGFFFYLSFHCTYIRLYLQFNYLYYLNIYNLLTYLLYYNF